MVIAEFEADRLQYECKWCHAVGQCVRKGNQDPDDRNVVCLAPGCGRHQFWLAKDENHSKLGKKRPALKSGTCEEVWTAFGDRCFHCGLDRKFLEAIGVGLTVQHVPPYDIAGHSAWLYPYCAWCNQDAAGRWKRMEAFAARVGLSRYLNRKDGDE